MVKTIAQKVTFRNTASGKLYSMYLDPKHHAAITGKPAKIIAKEGEKYSANGGGHYGKILQLIRNRLIVQTFRGSDWDKGDIDSTLVLLFEQKGDDTIIYMVHANVPDTQYREINDGWDAFYWKPWKRYLASLK